MFGSSQADGEYHYVERSNDIEPVHIIYPNLDGTNEIHAFQNLGVPNFIVHVEGGEVRGVAIQSMDPSEFRDEDLYYSEFRGGVLPYSVSGFEVENFEYDEWENTIRVNVSIEVRAEIDEYLSDSFFGTPLGLEATISRGYVLALDDRPIPQTRAVVGYIEESDVFIENDHWMALVENLLWGNTLEEGDPCDPYSQAYSFVKCEEKHRDDSDAEYSFCDPNSPHFNYWICRAHGGNPVHPCDPNSWQVYPAWLLDGLCEKVNDPCYPGHPNSSQCFDEEGLCKNLALADYQSQQQECERDYQAVLQLIDAAENGVGRAGRTLIRRFGVPLQFVKAAAFVEYNACLSAAKSQYESDLFFCN